MGGLARMGLPMRLPVRRDRSRPPFFLILVIVSSLIAGAPAARAQLGALDAAEPPGPFLREALGTPYARALLAELGRSIGTSADPACLQSKNLGAAQLDERARDLIETWGTRGLTQVAALRDAKAHEAQFAASAGADVPAELKRLREHPDVKRYLAIERDWRLAKIVDFVLEQFDRYALVARLKLKSVLPLASGNDALLRQNPIDSLADSLEAFRDKTKSGPLERYLELVDASAEAMKTTIKPEAAATALLGFFRGVENDLAALCIVKR